MKHIKSINESLDFNDSYEIDPCNLDQKTSKKLNDFFEANNITTSRRKCMCPCHRIEVHDWSKLDEKIKKQILKIIGK